MLMTFTKKGVSAKELQRQVKPQKVEYHLGANA
jgi:hypothetical protein